MDEGRSDTSSPVKRAAAVEDDDDFLVPSTGRARNRGGILDDEDSLGEWQEGLMGEAWSVAAGGGFSVLFPPRRRGVAEARSGQVGRR